MAIPFVVGQWVRGERFYGRESLLKEVLHGTRNCLWLLGTRRIGKTSLLKQLEHLTSAPQSGYLPVFLDFQGAVTLAELHQYFGDALIDAEERLERAGIALSEVEADDFFASLECLRRRLRSTGLRLLLLCDEVEELIGLGQMDPALLGKLRRALQSHDDVRSVLASTTRLWALADQRGDTSPFLHGFTPPLYIRTLCDEEARSLIRQDNLPAQLRPGFDPDTVERVRSRCDNHPYLIQLVCKRLLETADLEEALEQVATDEMVAHFFSVDFEMLSQKERDVLRVVAGQPAASSDSIQAEIDTETTSLGGSLHRFEQLGFVRRNGEGRFVLANAFFRRWLLERTSPALPAPGATRSGAESIGGAALAAGLTGSTLLHYRILRQLDSGGMGEVYGAEDTKLGREVALKLLPPELASDRDRLRRFRREARVLAALNHPNIVTIYAVEAVGDLHFITTELVAGRTLRTLMATRLPLEILLDLMLPLLDGLAAAHARGIVHRDLKPANVMVADDGRVKLLDFGVATFGSGRALHGWSDQDLRTAPGVMVGTLPYMSPEQILGRRVDHRTDLFSLGVILYEALAGTLPFERAVAEEWLTAILTSAPRPLREIRPDLPAAVDHVVGGCLEKEPDARYSSAVELRRALEALKGSPDAHGSAAANGTAAPSVRRRVEKLVRRLFRRS